MSDQSVVPYTPQSPDISALSSALPENTQVVPASASDTTRSTQHSASNTFSRVPPGVFGPSRTLPWSSLGLGTASGFAHSPFIAPGPGRSQTSAHNGMGTSPHGMTASPPLNTASGSIASAAAADETEIRTPISSGNGADPVKFSMASKGSNKSDKKNVFAAGGSYEGYKPSLKGPYALSTSALVKYNNLPSTQTSSYVGHGKNIGPFILLQIFSSANIAPIDTSASRDSSMSTSEALANDTHGEYTKLVRPAPGTLSNRPATSRASSSRQRYPSNEPRDRPLYNHNDRYNDRRPEPSAHRDNRVYNHNDLYNNQLSESSGRRGFGYIDTYQGTGTRRVLSRSLPRRRSPSPRRGRGLSDHNRLDDGPSGFRSRSPSFSRGRQGRSNRSPDDEPHSQPRRLRSSSRQEELPVKSSVADGLENDDSKALVKYGGLVAAEIEHREDDSKALVKYDGFAEAKSEAREDNSRDTQPVFVQITDSTPAIDPTIAKSNIRLQRIEDKPKLLHQADDDKPLLLSSSSSTDERPEDSEADNSHPSNSAVVAKKTVSDEDKLDAKCLAGKKFAPYMWAEFKMFRKFLPMVDRDKIRNVVENNEECRNNNRPQLTLLRICRKKDIKAPGDAQLYFWLVDYAKKMTKATKRRKVTVAPDLYKRFGLVLPPVIARQRLLRYDVPTTNDSKVSDNNNSTNGENSRMSRAVTVAPAPVSSAQGAAPHQSAGSTGAAQNTATTNANSAPTNSSQAATGFGASGAPNGATVAGSSIPPVVGSQAGATNSNAPASRNQAPIQRTGDQPLAFDSMKLKAPGLSTAGKKRREHEARIQAENEKKHLEEDAVRKDRETFWKAFPKIDSVHIEHAVNHNAQVRLTGKGDQYTVESLKSLNSVVYIEYKAPVAVFGTSSLKSKGTKGRKSGNDKRSRPSSVIPDTNGAKNKTKDTSKKRSCSTRDNDNGSKSSARPVKKARREESEQSPAKGSSNHVDDVDEKVEQGPKQMKVKGPAAEKLVPDLDWDKDQVAREEAREELLGGDEDGSDIFIGDEDPEDDDDLEENDATSGLKDEIEDLLSTAKGKKRGGVRKKGRTSGRANRQAASPISDNQVEEGVKAISEVDAEQQGISDEMQEVQVHVPRAETSHKRRRGDAFEVLRDPASEDADNEAADILSAKRQKTEADASAGILAENPAKGNQVLQLTGSTDDEKSKETSVVLYTAPSADPVPVVDAPVVPLASAAASAIEQSLVLPSSSATPVVNDPLAVTASAPVLPAVEALAPEVEVVESEYEEEVDGVELMDLDDTPSAPALIVPPPGSDPFPGGLPPLSDSGGENDEVMDSDSEGELDEPDSMDLDDMPSAPAPIDPPPAVTTYPGGLPPLPNSGDGEMVDDDQQSSDDDEEEEEDTVFVDRITKLAQNFSIGEQIEGKTNQVANELGLIHSIDRTGADSELLVVLLEDKSKVNEFFQHPYIKDLMKIFPHGVLLPDQLERLELNTVYTTCGVNRPFVILDCKHMPRVTEEDIMSSFASHISGDATGYLDSQWFAEEEVIRLQISQIQFPTLEEAREVFERDYGPQPDEAFIVTEEEHELGFTAEDKLCKFFGLDTPGYWDTTLNDYNTNWVLSQNPVDKKIIYTSPRVDDDDLPLTWSPWKGPFKVK